MAELFSLIISGTGILGLFNNCITEFEYIQLARHIDRDLQTCQLSLNLAKLRLARWGHTIDIYEGDPEFHGTPTTHKCIEAQQTLKQIYNLFRDLEKKSRRYTIPVPGRTRQSSPDVFDESEDPDGTYTEIYARARQITARDLEWNLKARSGVVARAKWAIHDSKAFERLLTHISQLINYLESLFPDRENRRTEEANKYVSGLDTAALLALRTAAAGVDDKVHGAAMPQDGTMSNNSVGHGVLSEEASMFVGNEYSEGVIVALNSSKSPAAVRFGGLVRSTANRVDWLEARGQSVNVVGSRFGGPSVVDLALAKPQRQS